jgi:hypothetical protein
MLAVRDEQGCLSGFIGRARPGAGEEVPEYLNSPQTPAYRKGELLFGLAEARELLAGGAVPVIVEGPFDAIAVTVAGGGRQVADRLRQQRRRGPQPLVVAGLAPQIREQVTQPAVGEPDPAVLAAEPEQHLGYRQAHQLGIAQPRPLAPPRRGRVT